jgi:hypothetical protein
MKRTATQGIGDLRLKNPRDSLGCRLIFAGELVYVATSQLKRSQHDRRQAQCAKALRAGRAFEKARSMEGRTEGRRPAQNKARCLMRLARK